MISRVDNRKTYAGLMNNGAVRLTAQETLSWKIFSYGNGGVSYLPYACRRFLYRTLGTKR